ncbi:MAG: hypothetical protein D0433_09740 [Candidatus Thermochlorobacter aerophilum]|uniref:Uncharacterized protein n=1 Tax=Candidatus Thermochlorobacter aerophilus TaxID=1868324 RepID=A0A395LYS8_9BACT|nr:MAG: hypothetical protein D0433_09740 [Candidatus Thermochlorobacter aerophilum]
MPVFYNAHFFLSFRAQRGIHIVWMLHYADASFSMTAVSFRTQRGIHIAWMLHYADASFSMTAVSFRTQ